MVDPGTDKAVGEVGLDPMVLTHGDSNPRSHKNKSKSFNTIGGREQDGNDNKLHLISVQELRNA